MKLSTAEKRRVVAALTYAIEREPTVVGRFSFLNLRKKFETSLAILTEECGEVAKEVADSSVRALDVEAYRTELIQAAAVAVAAVESLDRKLAAPQAPLVDAPGWLDRDLGPAS